jgi:SanA protein
LGTSKWGPEHRVNLFYKYRIQAALELYRAGKVEFILVSGDNSTEHYNEPESMRDDLIAAGVPASRIFLDYAGFRTLDSIVRCKAIFGEDNIVVISQRFHNARALFLADHKGMHAIGYNAGDVGGEGGFMVLLREKLARTKMALDLIIDKQPKYYGPKVVIR